jgi:hypothetical protein
MHVFTVTAVYNFLLVVLYEVTLYLVVKRGYQGVVKDREEAKKVPKD